MRVAVLAGGRSSEHEISLASGESVRAGLAEVGHDVVDVRLLRDGRWEHSGGPVELRPGGGLLAADVAFPVLHGPFGEDGTVQGLLELLDVPYVGAGVLASALCMDKVVFKELMKAARIPQVDFRAVRERIWLEDPGPVLDEVEDLGRPVFVKPARLGSSVGIAKVTEGGGELRAAIDRALRHDPLVIVEAMSEGIEVECAVLGHADPRASPPGEIVLPSADWYDYEAKYSPGGMELIVPARVPAAVAERVRGLAVDVFGLVGCSGLARVDFFVDGNDVLVNELNTLPGFTATSVYAKLWQAGGIHFGELCDRLVAHALERWRGEREGHEY